MIIAPAITGTGLVRTLGGNGADGIGTGGGGGGGTGGLIILITDDGASPIATDVSGGIAGTGGAGASDGADGYVKQFRVS
jgi:hypothetical protein